MGVVMASPCHVRRSSSRGDRYRRSVAVLASVRRTVLVFGAALLAAGCGSTGPRTGEVLVADAGEVAAMVGLDDGGLRIGERGSGEISEVDAGGRTRRLTRVDVRSGGQRGLLGLAVDGADRTFAAWTRPDGRLVVGQVAPGPTRLVWRGPSSTELGNGGHVAFAGDGRLVLGVGDLQAPALADDPDAANGKMLALDPDGPPDQRPVVLSDGYTNPFAFAVTPGGALWVFDNATRSDPERLVRGDQPAEPALEQVEEMAPSGLAAVAEDQLVVCGYRSRTLEHVAIHADGSATRGNVLAEDCAFGVAVLADGRIAYGDGESVRVVRR